MHERAGLAATVGTPIRQGSVEFGVEPPMRSQGAYPLQLRLGGLASVKRIIKALAQLTDLFAALGELGKVATGERGYGMPAQQLPLAHLSVKIEAETEIGGLLVEAAEEVLGLVGTAERVAMDLRPDPAGKLEGEATLAVEALQGMEALIEVEHGDSLGGLYRVKAKCACSPDH